MTITAPAESAGHQSAAPECARADDATSQEAFEKFYAWSYPLALNCAYRWVHNRELAEEIVEAAFFRIVKQARGTPRWSDYSRSYVYRVVLNQLRQHHRRATRYRRLLQRWTGTSPSVTFPPPAEALDFEHVSTALAALDEKYSQVLRLRYLESLSTAEIAAVVLAPESTVRTRLQRGLALLRRRLGQYGGLPGRPEGVVP